MRCDIYDVVPLVVRRGHRVVQARSRVPERGIDEPPLPLAERDVPPIPNPRVPILPVPIEVANVARLKIDGVPIEWTQHRDACVLAGRGLRNQEHRQRNDP